MHFCVCACAHACAPNGFAYHAHVLAHALHASGAHGCMQVCTHMDPFLWSAAATTRRHSRPRPVHALTRGAAPARGAACM